MFLQDDVWCTRCIELLSSPAFNPSNIPSVAPSALCEYLGLTSTRQLYIALIHLPCVPVGIWYRTDASALPNGELLSVYADGRGAYKMSPLDYHGGVIRELELMRTDICSTSCARISICSKHAIGEVSQQASRKQRPPNSRSVDRTETQALLGAGSSSVGTLVSHELHTPACCHPSQPGMKVKSEWAGTTRNLTSQANHGDQEAPHPHQPTQTKPNNAPHNKI